MRIFRNCSRTLIFCLLFLWFAVTVFMLSWLKSTRTDVSEERVEDLAVIKLRREAQTLNAIEQEENEGFKEPPQVVYEDYSTKSLVNHTSTEDAKAARKDTNEGGEVKQEAEELTVSGLREESHAAASKDNRAERTRSRRKLEEKVKEMKDQVIRAKAYLNFMPQNSSSQSVKELKLRIKEVLRAMNQCTKDSHISRSSLQKMKAMESSLSKVSRIYPDCDAMMKKLLAMTYSAEGQVRAQRNQERFLRAVGGRTIPKGLHCLSMRLTAEYFALEPEQRKLPYEQKMRALHLYHLAIFSDNVLACSAVINSTISTSSDPERMVFHIVTDSINFPAISMWFLSNPPGEATIQVESIENFQWLTAKYNVELQGEGSTDPRVISDLNHLRFYLPDVFPHLNKIIFLDHDMVVQRDLTRLWITDMKGRANAAVQICTAGAPSFRRIDMLVNFTDPMVASTLDANACTWAFGVNLFNLYEWRRRDLTRVYTKYLHLVSNFDLAFLYPCIARDSTVKDLQHLIELVSISPFRPIISTVLWVSLSSCLMLRQNDGKCCFKLFFSYLLNEKSFYLQSKERPLFKEAGSLPIGWLTFHKQTVALDKSWLVLDLGYDSGISQDKIDQAAFIHFNGIQKPWLDIGIEQYKHLWQKHVNYEHPFLQQCNIHE